MVEHRILLVNGDDEFCETVRYNLRNDGYAVDIAYSAEEALLKNINDYNLAVLDVKLKGMSGFKLAQKIRNNPKTEMVPLVFLSAKSDENDKLTAYSIGADDYITKPFFIRELLARIKIIISRAEARKPNQTHIVSYDHLQLNVTNKQVLLDGKELWFTKKEFEILKLLLENKNTLFSRDELLRMVWNEDAFVLKRSIDVNITRIRKKIGKYGQRIITILGSGYYFEG